MKIRVVVGPHQDTRQIRCSHESTEGNPELYLQIQKGKTHNNIPLPMVFRTRIFSLGMMVPVYCLIKSAIVDNPTEVHKILIKY